MIGWAAMTFFIAMNCLFVFALILGDNSIIDVFYGPSFIIAASIVSLQFASWHPRRVLVMSLLALWGIRLGAHLLVRHRGRGEDFRHLKWRKTGGRSSYWRSCLQLYMLQGAVIISLCILASHRFGPRQGKGRYRP